MNKVKTLHSAVADIMYLNNLRLEVNKVKTLVS